MVPPLPPKILPRLLFWLFLTCSSVFMAEVTCYASPFPFFEPWGLLVVCPLYGLHLLVLAGWLARRKRLTLERPFLAGMIFGLYEAYVTKVLFLPTWGDYQPVGAEGISLLQTLVLVFFWHPWMAFILPLMAGEQLLTGTREVRLGVWLQRHRTAILIGLGIYAGMCQGLNAASWMLGLLSALANGGVLVLLAWLWRRLAKGRAYSLRQLLPAGKTWWLLLGLLLGSYAWQLCLIRPEALPRQLLPHLEVLFLYIAAFGLLGGIGRKTEDSSPELPQPIAPPWRAIGLFGGVFILSGFFFAQVKPAAALGVLLSWGVGISLGIFLLLRSAWLVVKR